MSLAIIINPISGTGGRPEVARRRAEQAAAFTAAAGERAEIFVTERAGHARELACGAIERGASTVVAWGGDGTVNEVANALAFTPAALAVVPSGSGNGLARELGVPFEPVAALDVALRGRTRLIDGGELDGRLFVNIAGVGLDARVAHQFARHGLVRRGFLRYLEIGTRELLAFTPTTHRVDADGWHIERAVLLIAIANARQYGNGALIAPQAVIDDGRLDVVVVAGRPLWQTLRQVPRLFTGQIGKVPGVSMRSVESVTISAAPPIAYHVDGEPFVSDGPLVARIRPGALRVQVPLP